MKNEILILLLFFLSIKIFSQYNGGIITYKQKIIIPQKNTSSKKQKFAEMYNAERRKMNQVSDQITYILKFNKDESSFKSKSIMGVDDTDETVAFALMHVEGDGERYFSNETNISLWAHEAFGKNVILVDTIKSADWNITAETKTINDFKVVKATKSKTLHNKKTIEVSAWFTPEIPFGYGPVGNYGLPGIILELHEKDFIIYATNIILSEKRIKIKKPKKGKYLSKTEYEKYIGDAVKKLGFE